VPGLPCYAAQTLALTGKMEIFAASNLTVLSFYSFYTFSDPKKCKAFNLLLKEKDITSFFN
jgi:hypothetical protein